MSHFGKFLMVVAVFGFVIVTAALIFDSVSSNVSISLLPGQTLRVANDHHHKIHIQAEYPISISEGRCQYAHIVDLKYSCPAADLLITDERPILLLWAHSNRVQISAPMW